MIEKRFADIEIGADIGQIRLYTTDKDYETYRSDDVLKLINRLSEENEQLKQQVNCHKSRIQLLSPLLDLADTIIDLSDDEKAKAFWEKKNNEVEQEWNKILKGDFE